MATAARAASKWLLAAGAASAGIAGFHVVVMFVGAPAYRYFGAGERLAQLAESGSYVPTLVTASVAVVVAVFAWYGLAGADMTVRPPLLRAGLVSIAAVFLLRGASVFSQMVSVVLRPGALATREVTYSAVSLLVGLCYAVGTWRRWHSLKVDRRNAG